MLVRMKIFLFLLLTIILISCNKKNAEQKIEYDEIKLVTLENSLEETAVSSLSTARESYFASKSFRDEAKKRIEYIIMNEGPYDIYRENSIAANFLIGIFELLKGKSFKEVKEYCGLNENTLKEAGVTEDINMSDPISSVEQYVLGLGFNEEMLAKLKINLKENE